MTSKDKYCFCLKPYRPKKINPNIPISENFGRITRLSYTEAYLILFSVAFGLGYNTLHS